MEEEGGGAAAAREEEKVGEGSREEGERGERVAGEGAGRGRHETGSRSRRGRWSGRVWRQQRLHRRHRIGVLNRRPFGPLLFFRAYRPTAHVQMSWPINALSHPKPFSKFSRPGPNVWNRIRNAWVLP